MMLQWTNSFKLWALNFLNYKRNQQTFFKINHAKTWIENWADRIESDFTAFRSWRPAFTNVVDTCPLASLVFPRSSAPATALPLCPSVTVRTTGWPTCAVVGPVIFKKCFALKPLNANRISSSALTSCWQPPTGVNWKLRSKPQNWEAVCASPAMEVMKKSSKSVENEL